MAALALCLFVIAAGGVLFSLRGGRPRPSALWLCGWIFLLVSGLCLQLDAASAWAPSFVHFTSPLLPACLLAGALAYTDRAVPAWLLPGAALFGGLRAGLLLAGRPEVAHGLALGVEPTAELVGALLVLRARPTTRAGLGLAASFLGVAALDAISAVGGVRSSPMGSPVLWGWAVMAPLALGIQIAAGGQRALERERRHLLERRRMEEALRVSEGRFQALTENAFDLIAETDAEGRITYTNPRFQEVLACAAPEAIGRSLHHFVHPEDHARMLRWQHQLIESGAAPPVLARWRRGDGSWRSIESAGKVFRAPEGERRIVASLRDVTRRTEAEEALRRAHDDLEQRVEERTSQLVEVNRSLALEVAARRSAEEKLRTSEERYRTISEISADLSFAYRVEADGRLVREWITEALTRITGYTPQEFDRGGLAQLAHPDDLEAIRSHLSAALCGEVRKFEARIVTKWGEARWLRARLAGLRSPVDGHFRLVGATQDVTEARQAEKERRNIEKHVREMQRLESLGVLAGGIAHDFNNLLSVIQGNCALALGDLGADSPVHKRLARIQAAARHAAGLTDQMLTYSGRASVTLKPLDLSRLIDDLHQLLEASVVGAGASLQTRLAQPLPLVQGDDTQLRQVVVNLVTNASEALDDGGGTIAIATGSVFLGRGDLAGAFASPDLPEGEYVYLEVSDTGRGMDPATRERIFEPFFSTKVPGRGMGLAAVLGIVQGHRGALKVLSEPGQGTSFQVLLPRSGAPARPTPVPPPARAGGLPALVLVVDDEELVLEVAREFLERAGFNVSTAGGGEECLRLLEERGAEIDAVVLDLWMPGLDGEETLLRLRRLRPDLPVILASGYRDDPADRRFDRHGVAGFLRKPYEPEELTEKIQAALDLARTA